MSEYIPGYIKLTEKEYSRNKQRRKFLPDYDINIELEGDACLSMGKWIEEEFKKQFNQNNKKYNLVLPIAGKAERFLKEGYSQPKPLIHARHKHIIDWAMDSIDTSNCNLIFIVRLDHIYSFSIDEVLRSKFGEDIVVIPLEHITRGSLETCLAAKPYIDNDEPLYIYTPDVTFSPQFIPESMTKDGLLLTFKANSSAHSYAQEKNEYVTKTAEKEVISENALVGVYGFKEGRDFVRVAEQIVKNNEMGNLSEFYIAPMYNQLIQEGKKIKTQSVECMNVLGTPTELKFYVDRVLASWDKPIAVCSDHSGFELKSDILEVLKEEGFDYIDFGCYTNKACDYSDYSASAVRAVNEGTSDFIIATCRSGQGMATSCAYLGMYSAIVNDEWTAEMCRRHNCSNAFCIPSKTVNKEKFRAILHKLVTSNFEGGRHLSRIKEFDRRVK